MIEAEMTTEGQQPFELIKKIKQQQTGITKTVCSKIIEGFYKEFGIDKEVDQDILTYEIVRQQGCFLPEGLMEFVYCLGYICTNKDFEVTYLEYDPLTTGYTLGRDLLLDMYANLVEAEGNKKEIHYLVSKCLDLCVPF